MLIKAGQVFILTVVLMGAYNTFSRLDGHFFPVYSNMWLVSAEDIPGTPNVSLVHMKFHKVRECKHLATQWYIGVPDASVGVLSDWADPPKFLHGNTDGDSYRRVNMTADAIRNNSYAITTHDCYGGWLWETKTVAWLSSRDNPNHEDSTWKGREEQ